MRSVRSLWCGLVVLIACDQRQPLVHRSTPDGSGGDARMDYPPDLAPNVDSRAANCLDVDQKLCGEVRFQLAGYTRDSCMFELPALPPWPECVEVEADGVCVSRDAPRTPGWAFTDGYGRHVAIYGALCDALKAGQVTELRVLIGCKCRHELL